MLPLLIPAGIAAIGAIGRAISRDQTNKSIEAAARKRLGLAQSFLNARMPGATDFERNLLTAQGTTLDTIKKNTSDPTQVINAAVDTQARTDRELSNLQTAEKQNKYNLLDNLNSAYDQMTEVKAAQGQNNANTFGDIFNIGTSLLPFTSEFGMTQGMGGGFGGNSRMRIPQFSGTFGNQGYLSPGLMNRRTPNFN